MEEIGNGLSLLAIFGFIAFLIWNGERVKQQRRQLRLEERRQLFEQFGSPDALTSFLESEHGKNMLEESGDSTPAYRPAGIKLAIVGLLTGGVICTCVGLGFYLVAPLVEIRELLIPAAIVGAVGVGCIIAAALHYVLGRSWGLIGPRAEEFPARRRLE